MSDDQIRDGIDEDELGDVAGEGPAGRVLEDIGRKGGRTESLYEGEATGGIAGGDGTAGGTSGEGTRAAGGGSDDSDWGRRPS